MRKFPASNVADLKAEDIAKVFGNQENFNMLKGLLNQAVFPGAAAPKTSIKRQTQQKFSSGAPPRPIKPSVVPTTQQSQKTAPTTVTSGNEKIDSQVEQALLDLNDLKTEAVMKTAAT